MTVCPCGHHARYHGTTGCHHPTEGPDSPACDCTRTPPKEHT